MEKWNDGRVEYWSHGIMDRILFAILGSSDSSHSVIPYSIIPLFQHSNYCRGIS